MKKFALTLGMCLVGVLSAQALQEEWVNRAVVNNPQIDATTVRNYGIINLDPPVGYPYLFDNVQYFYNESSGLLTVNAPGLRLNYHDAFLGETLANEFPMELYWNEGEMRGGSRVFIGGAILSGALQVPSLNIRAKNVVDSGVTDLGDSLGAIDISATEGLDLWGAQYSAMGGFSKPLTQTGNVDGSNVRPGGVFPYVWSHGVRHLVDVTSLGEGFSVPGETPSGGGMNVVISVPTVTDNDGNYQWWEKANGKVYINQTMYDPGDPKPLYQVVFVPGDSIDYKKDDAGNIVGCNSYNQFRVTFGSAPVETLAGVSFPLGNTATPPFFPLGYTDKSGEHGAWSVIVTQYVYEGQDNQQGLRHPRYSQFYWEDLTGYFYDEMATNQFIMDVDGRGYIPDRFRLNVDNSPIDYRYFYRHEDGPYVDGDLEDGPLSLPLRYAINDEGWPVYVDAATINTTPRTVIPNDPITGEPVPAAGQVPMRVPTWTQEMMGATGPFMAEVGYSCLNGSLTQGIDDLKWLRRGGLPYRIDPENHNNAIVDIDYSAYQTSIGTNAFDKITLLMDGSPIIGDKESSDYPGHITLTGGEGENILDNMVAEAQQSVTLNITNLVSAENVILNANYINAFFSRLKDANFPDRKMVLKEVVSPTMTRLQGNMALFSGIYKVTFQISDTPYVRNPEPEPEPEPEPVDPDNPDAGEGEGEGEEEPEWEDKEFVFHLVYVGTAKDPTLPFTVVTKYVDTVPMVDRYDVRTEVPVEITETMELGENFCFETPDLTLRGTMTFPSTVNDEKILNVTHFTNYAVLKSQGDRRLSGSATNTFENSPSINLLLGTARELRFENFVHQGLFQFNEIQLTADTLEFLNSGSSASYEGTILTADKMRLYGGLVRAGADVNIIAKDLDLFDTGIEGGNAQLSSYLSSSVGISAGKIVLNVPGHLDDGVNGTVDADGNKVELPENQIRMRGSFEMPVKPATGDLLNTSLEINNVRVARNIWAGEDRGDTLEGWTNNVALGTLTLSGELTGNEALRFDFAPPTGKTSGALYVRDLYLGVRADPSEQGNLDYGKMLAYLQRNGMKLYYVNCYVREELDYRNGTFRWVLCDEFPGTNSSVIQTKNHPIFGNNELPGGVTTAEMNLGIHSAGSSSVEGEVLNVENLRLSWSAVAGVAYEVQVADSLNAEWTSYFKTTPTQDGEIVIPLEPASSQKFFRLIRSTL